MKPQSNSAGKEWKIKGHLNACSIYKKVGELMVQIEINGYKLVATTEAYLQSY